MAIHSSATGCVPAWPAEAYVFAHASASHISFDTAEGRLRRQRKAQVGKKRRSRARALSRALTLLASHDR